MKAPLLLAAAVALTACSNPPAPASKAANCAAADGGTVKIEDAWVRVQGDAAGMSAAYFTLCNAGSSPVTIEGLSTPAAGIVELHETTRDANGVVSMAPTGPITLVPGEMLAFEPGGKHAMLMSLAAPIADGASIALTLELGDGKTVTAEAAARSATDAAAHKH